MSPRVALVVWASCLTFTSGTSLVSPLPSTLEPEYTTVTLPDGSKLRGTTTESGSVRLFRGVPYSEKIERWTSPVMKKPWSSELDVTDFKPNCMQYSYLGPAWASLKGPFSEDCLYLNVYAPSLPPGNRTDDLRYPVMVFIHGGGFAYGGSHDTELDGVAQATLADVIVVTINYRLDVFGWLASERFKPGTQHSGNWGLQDQQLALEWVHRNIGAFYGDRKRVLIYGESAGAGAVSCHVASELSWPYFSRAAMQSGGFQNWAAKNLSVAEGQYDAMAKAVGCHPDDLTCMRNQSVSDLLYYSEGFSAHLPIQDSWDTSRWSPVVDGVILKAHPLKQLSHGKVAPVPLLLGTNRDEGVSFQSYSHTGVDPDPPASSMSLAEFDSWFTRNFGAAQLGVVHSLYPVGPHLNLTTYYGAATRLIGDYMMSCPNRRFARLHSSLTPNSTYVYSFAEVPGHAKKDNLGVFHGAEIRFVFFGAVSLDNWDEKALSQDMVRYWSNFAASGNPNQRRGTEGYINHYGDWLPFERRHQNYLLFKLPAGEVAREAFRNAKCDFWDSMPYPLH